MSNDFSFIDLNTGDVAYCEECRKAGVEVKLGELIVDEGKEPQADADQWCQCPRCGRKKALYERKTEGQWVYPFDTSSNPFDSTSKFEAVKKRKYKNRLDKDRDLVLS